MEWKKGLAALAICLGLGYGAGVMRHWDELAQREYEQSVAPTPRKTRAPEPVILQPEPAAEPRPEIIRDAVAAVPAARALPAPAILLPAPRPAPKPVFIPKGAPMIRAGDFKEMLSNPAEFIVSKTWLGRPEGFRRFASDPERARRYVNNPVVKTVLDNPALLKALISNPAIVKAFMESPAMRDPKTMQVLASSPLLKRISETKGFEALVKDPSAMNKVAMSLVANPQALALLGAATK